MKGSAAIGFVKPNCPEARPDDRNWLNDLERSGGLTGGSSIHECREQEYFVRELNVDSDRTYENDGMGFQRFDGLEPGGFVMPCSSMNQL